MSHLPGYKHQIALCRFVTHRKGFNSETNNPESYFPSLYNLQICFPQSQPRLNPLSRFSDSPAVPLLELSSFSSFPSDSGVSFGLGISPTNDLELHVVAVQREVGVDPETVSCAHFLSLRRRRVEEDVSGTWQGYCAIVIHLCVLLFSF